MSWKSETIYSSPPDSSLILNKASIQERENFPLPRVQGDSPLFTQNAQEGMEHAPVLQICKSSIDLLALDLQPRFGSIYREGSWEQKNMNVENLMPSPDWQAQQQKISTQKFFF